MELQKGGNTTTTGRNQKQYSSRLLTKATTVNEENLTSLQSKNALEA